MIAQPFSLLSEDHVKAGNPKKTLDYISSLLPLPPSSDLSFTVTALAYLSPEQLSAALDELSPAIYGSLEWINLNQNVALTSIITSRLSLLTCPETGRCKNSQNHLWIQPYGTWNSYDKLQEIPGFNSNQIGFALGYDRKIQDFYFGVFGSYSFTEVNYHQDGGSGDIDTVFGGLYGKYASPSNLTIETATIFSGNFYDLKRKIKYGDGNITHTIERTAKSNYNAFSFATHLGLAYDFNQFSAPVGLLANLDYSYLNQDSFDESGADCLNLSVEKQTSNMLQTELGTFFSKSFIFKTRCVTPFVGMSWIVKIPLQDGVIVSNLEKQNETFKIDTANKALQFFAPKVAIKFSTKNCLALTLEAFAELSGQHKNYFVTGRVEKRF